MGLLRHRHLGRRTRSPARVTARPMASCSRPRSALRERRSRR